MSRRRGVRVSVFTAQPVHHGGDALRCSIQLTEVQGHDNGGSVDRDDEDAAGSGRLLPTGGQTKDSSESSWVASGEGEVDSLTVQLCGVLVSPRLKDHPAVVYWRDAARTATTVADQSNGNARQRSKAAARVERSASSSTSSSSGAHEVAACAGRDAESSSSLPPCIFSLSSFGPGAKFITMSPLHTVCRNVNFRKSNGGQSAHWYGFECALPPFLPPSFIGAFARISYFLFFLMRRGNLASTASGGDPDSVVGGRSVSDKQVKMPATPFALLRFSLPLYVVGPPHPRIPIMPLLGAPVVAKSTSSSSPSPKIMNQQSANCCEGPSDDRHVERDDRGYGTTATTNSSSSETNRAAAATVSDSVAIAPAWCLSLVGPRCESPGTAACDSGQQRRDAARRSSRNWQLQPALAADPRSNDVVTPTEFDNKSSLRCCWTCVDAAAVGEFDFRMRSWLGGDANTQLTTVEEPFVTSESQRKVASQKTRAATPPNVHDAVAGLWSLKRILGASNPIGGRGTHIRQMLPAAAATRAEAVWRRRDNMSRKEKKTVEHMAELLLDAVQTPAVAERSGGGGQAGSSEGLFSLASSLGQSGGDGGGGLEELGHGLELYSPDVNIHEHDAEDALTVWKQTTTGTKSGAALSGAAERMRNGESVGNENEDDDDDDDDDEEHGDAALEYRKRGMASAKIRRSSLLSESSSGGEDRGPAGSRLTDGDDDDDDDEEEEEEEEEEALFFAREKVRVGLGSGVVGILEIRGLKRDVAAERHHPAGLIVFAAQPGQCFGASIDFRKGDAVCYEVHVQLVRDEHLRTPLSEGPNIEATSHTTSSAALSSSSSTAETRSVVVGEERVVVVNKTRGHVSFTMPAVAVPSFSSEIVSVTYRLIFRFFCAAVNGQLHGTDEVSKNLAAAAAGNVKSGQYQETSYRALQKALLKKRHIVELTWDSAVTLQCCEQRHQHSSGSSGASDGGRVYSLNANASVMSAEALLRMQRSYML